MAEPLLTTAVACADDDSLTAFGRFVVQTHRERRISYYGSPLHGTSAVYCIFVAASVITMLFYTYFAICPMPFHFAVISALGAPKWLAHTTIAVLPFLIGTAALRCISARSVLFSKATNEMCGSILDDEAFINKISEAQRLKTKKYHSTWLAVPIITMLVYGLMQIQVDRDTFWGSIAFSLPYLVITFYSSLSFPVLAKLAKISFRRAMDVCDALEDQLNKLQESDSEPLANPDGDTVFWEQISSQHLRLDTDLECLWHWSSGGGLVFADMAHKVLLLLVCVFVAAGTCILQVRVVLIIASTGVVVQMLRCLWPLAKVTSCCQGTAAGTKSILRLCACFLNHSSMSQGAQMAQGRFFQYLSTTPTGVELPFIGLVTVKGLVMAGKVAATAAPFFLTLSLKAWASEHDGDVKQCIQACIAGNTSTTGV